MLGREWIFRKLEKRIEKAYTAGDYKEARSAVKAYINIGEAQGMSVELREELLALKADIESRMEYLNRK